MSRFVVLLALLVIASACTVSPSEHASDPDAGYGPIVNLTLGSSLVPIDGGIVVIDPNATGEVFVYEYCGIPGALLRRDRVAYRYVFPIDERCIDPVNASFSDRLVVPLSAFEEQGVRIGEGEYEFKVFYASVAPGVGVRETNLFFNVTG